MIQLLSLATANSSEAKQRQQRPRRPSTSVSLRNLSKSFTRPSFRENGGQTGSNSVSASFDQLDSPQHLECLRLISAVRKYYQDQEIPPICLSKLRSTSSLQPLQEVETAEASDALPESLREQLELEYDDLVPYKGRLMTARPLHFAIWLASTTIPEEDYVDHCEDVKILLWAKADPSSCATYMRKNEAVRLPALHIAAGLGVIEVMEALLAEFSDEAAEEEIDRYCMCGDRPFYCALHDAVFNGKAQAAVWLLEHYADPSARNMEGFTALHWLALRGMDEDEDVEVVVRSLVRARASVDDSTEEGNGSVRGRIPLELAVKPGSLFPKHLLYLLAPSYQVLEQKMHAMNVPRCSFFEDLALMSGHSGKAAQDFADRVARMHGPTAKHKAIVDAQDENAADCMASLLQMAPEAAASMLGLLLAKPIQENPGHHSLSSRAILGGRTMQCAYKPDMRETRLGARQDRVRWPEWKYDVNTGQMPVWHSSFLRVPREKQARSASVFDVETLALLLPNILDIDIFMALASARSVHRQIFNSLAIKAAVHCLWIELISPVFGLTLLFNTLDLVVLALWGLTPSRRPLLWRIIGSEGAKEEGRNSSLQYPRFANFLLAGLLRDVTNIGWWLFGLCRKWLRHQSQHSLRASSAEARVQELRSGLHALWHPMKIFDLSHNTNTPELILCMLKTVFLISVQCSSNCEREMPDTTQALLAVCFFMHCVKLIYMLRVSSLGGKKILVLIKTLVSGAMREIFLIFCLFFVAFALTAVMLDRSVAVGFLSWSLYRGLIFGDGAGLDNMGFAIEGLSTGDLDRRTLDVDVLTTLLTVMAILGTVTFIVILNMIIAIYSTEYGRLEMESDLLFQWERAKYCCNCLLGMQKLRSRNRIWLHLTRFVVIGSLAGSLAFFVSFPTGPEALSASPPFPAAAFLLGAAQVGMQALMMRSDWFAVGSGGREGPVQEHFLWIVRRCEQTDLRAERYAESEVEVQTRLTQQLLSELREQRSSRPSKAASHMGAVSRRPTTPRSNPMSPKRSGSRTRSPRPLAESGKTSL